MLESRKETQTNAETLHSLLVGIENLGENVKNMQEEMIAWQSGYQDAEREYQTMNEAILQEVPLPAPAVRPEGSVNPPPVSIPPVSTSQFTVPSAENVPQSSGQPSEQAVGQSMDEDIQARWAKVSALRKSYPGAPPPANWGSMGFNVTTPSDSSNSSTNPSIL